MYLGIWSIIVQELVENDYEEGTIVGTSLILNMISAPLCVIGIIAFTMIANIGETETILVCALYSTLLIFQAFEVIQYWFQLVYVFFITPKADRNFIFHVVLRKGYYLKESTIFCQV